MKKLYRSRRTRILGGVAAGFAEYFGTDVTLIRIVFAFIGITVPSSILAYILAWMIIPEDNTGYVPASMEASAPTGNVPPTASELVEDRASSTEIPSQASQSSQANQPQETPVEPERNRQVLGYILIAVGLIVISKRYIPSFIWRLPTQLIGQAWPVLIILVGALLIFGAIRGR